MTDKPDDEKCRLQSALYLNKVIKKILDSSTFKAYAEISAQRLLDVIQRWEHDMTRLEAHQNAGIHPTKYIAYQAFWIRKLKPVSNAYKKSDLERAKKKEITEKELALREIQDINERLAVIVAVKHLVRLCDTGKYPIPSNGATYGVPPVSREIIRDYIRQYLSYPGRGDGHGITYGNLLYNMRYRTFGPHHLTHIIDQMLFGATLLKGK